MIFATIASRVLHKTTRLLEGLDKVTMTRDLYLRGVCPIAALFSVALVFSNYAYLHLSVALIQMLKAC